MDVDDSWGGSSRYSVNVHVWVYASSVCEHVARLTPMRRRVGDKDSVGRILGGFKSTMGCGKSKELPSFEVDESKVGHGQSTYDLCHEFLKLDNEGVNQFYRLFKQIDKNDSNSFKPEDFYKYLKQDRTKFTDRCLHFLDSTGNANIDFETFVIGIWVFMTVQKQTFVRFAFSLYDEEQSHRLKPEVVQEMFADVYGEHWKNNHNVFNVVEKMMDESLDGGMSLQKFEEYSKKYDKLLFPMLQMQLHMKDRIFGAEYWAGESRKRNELYGDVPDNLKQHLLKLVVEMAKGTGGERTDEHADKSVSRDNPYVVHDENVSTVKFSMPKPGAQQEKDKKHKKHKKHKKDKKHKKKKKDSKYGKTVSDSESEDDDWWRREHFRTAN